MHRIRDAIEVGAGKLSHAGVEAPRRDARVLLADTLKADLGYLIGHDEECLPELSWESYLRRIERRARREPVSRIVGRREFWGREFHIGPETLDPRPDSETLIDTVLERIPEVEQPLRMLDLGTGSGCLLISLLLECPRAIGIGIDRSFAAASLAGKNAARLGVAQRSLFCVASWLQALGGQFDLIIANPPYVRSADIAGLAPEVANYEPALALDGGDDGLASYRAFVPILPEHLAENGLAVLEVGEGQASAVEALLRNAGLSSLDCRRDLAGRRRCLVAGR